MQVETELSFVEKQKNQIRAGKALVQQQKDHYGLAQDATLADAIKIMEERAVVIFTDPSEREEGLAAITRTLQIIFAEEEKIKRAEISLAQREQQMTEVKEALVSGAQQLLKKSGLWTEEEIVKITSVQNTPENREKAAENLGYIAAEKENPFAPTAQAILGDGIKRGLFPPPKNITTKKAEAQPLLHKKDEDSCAPSCCVLS